MKRIVAGVITIVLLALVVWFGMRRTSSDTEETKSTPEACIDRMFAAAERGEVDAYLDCFTGPERDRIERELAEQPRDVFARSLIETVESLKGWAVFEAPSKAANTDEIAWLTVERIYANRMERQTYHLICESGVWRIHSIRTAEAKQPDLPYGTPVFELPRHDESSANQSNDE